MQFRDQVSIVDWKAVIRANNGTELAFGIFQNIFSNMFDQCFPLTKVRTKYNNLTFRESLKLRELSDMLLEMNEIRKCNRSPYYTHQYKRLLKIHHLSLHREKRQFCEEKILSANNRARTVWNIIKGHDVKRIEIKTITTLVDEEENSITEP
ncbi:hypothetical protein HHI36_018204 [Cryptolaemus montrouzieri]|uniref:Uncharacterized protein n=1 Tax=Cryptolaemus montrouzieri TaxID=559131 RepID=A0ABD2NZX2_9CUCU